MTRPAAGIWLAIPRTSSGRRDGRFSKSAPERWASRSRVCSANMLSPRMLALATAKAQSVIHIFLPGGMAHQESFDPKPLRRSNTAARWGSYRPSSTASSSTSASSRRRRSPTRSRSAAR